MTLQAYTEFCKIKTAVAFTITGAKRRNVNQYMRAYTFNDGSILRIYRDGRASVATGLGDYKTILIGLIRANAFN